MNINAGSSVKMEHGSIFNSGILERVIDLEVAHRFH